LVPFAIIFAAEGLFFLNRIIQTYSNRLGNLILITLILLAIIPQLTNSIKFNQLLSTKDTRTIAKEWIEVNIPENSKVAIDWPVHAPPLSTTEKQIPNSKRVYDIHTVGGSGLSDHNIGWYIEKNIDYIITSNFISDIPVVSQEMEQERMLFYQSLDQELDMVQSFYPNNKQEITFIIDEIYGPFISLWQRYRPGPVIKIYQIYYKQ
jgi:hypothetical protein